MLFLKEVSSGNICQIKKYILVKFINELFYSKNDILKYLIKLSKVTSKKLGNLIICRESMSQTATNSHKVRGSIRYMIYFYTFNFNTHFLIFYSGTLFGETNFYCVGMNIVVSIFIAVYNKVFVKI